MAAITASSPGRSRSPKTPLRPAARAVSDAPAPGHAPASPDGVRTSADAGRSAQGLLDEIGAHREVMLRFARRRMRDADLAEDAVQDAMASAVAALGSFQGDSALRTWLIGILGHKIQDIFRREGRYVRIHGEPGELDAGGMALGGGEHDGADPFALVARRRLGQALHGEIDALPPGLREVFRLQVLEGTPTAEVCRRLRISESNCWVRLHRARKRLASRMSLHFA
ncbi:MAG: sigma-70 family RNA polymerase sigma factor [Burkholderiaceae bacterium]|nr:sigma-70 family RNA polymerase sigma factor [Burkholderiaceae bacterium]